MNDTLLWSLDETARQLGGISTRTVRRLLDRGELPVVRIGRTVRIPARAVRRYVETNMPEAHTQPSAGPGMRKKEKNVCHTVAKTVPFGGRPTPTQAAAELGALLGQPIAGKQRP